MIYFRGRLFILKDEALRKEIIVDAHSTLYTTRIGGTKMYRGLQDKFWWRNMNKGIGMF